MASRVFLPDGDIEIRFSSTDETYILHAGLLRPYSPWFKASLSDRWRTEHEATTINGKQYWVYELRFEKDSDMGMLMRKAEGGPTTSTSTEFIQGSKAKIPDSMPPAQKVLHEKRVACIRAHQDLFAAFYFVRPAFSTTSFPSAWSSILDLMHVAAVYECNDRVLRNPIDDALQLHQTEILRLCATQPMDMLELAKATKSGWMFKEAATNLLRRSEPYFHIMQPRLEEIGVTALMESKRAIFTQCLEHIELQLFKIQPKSDTWTSRIAVTRFREWLSKRLVAGKGSGLSPGYALVYHLIKRMSLSTRLTIRHELLTLIAQIRGQAHLGSASQEVLETNFEIEIKHIFKSAAQIIEVITRDRTLRQDKTPDEHRALTCMELKDNELPWQVE